MAKKLSDIENKVRLASAGFKLYLSHSLDSTVLSAIEAIEKNSQIYVFSGVIRNYFLGIPSMRDLDIMVSKELDVSKFFKNHEVKINSFGGFKVFTQNLTIDIWVLKNSWALNHQRTLNFDLEKYIPSTSFFNFSSIVFDWNESQFYFTKHFLQFLQNKEIDVVYHPNHNYDLCLINTFYYSEKYKLRISSELKKYLTYIYNTNRSENYERIQHKHFGRVLYSSQDLALRMSNLFQSNDKSDEIICTYKSTFPEFLLKSFLKSLDMSNFRVSAPKLDEEFFNFEGPDPYDLKISLNYLNLESQLIQISFEHSLYGLFNSLKTNKAHSLAISIKYHSPNNRTINFVIENANRIDNVFKMVKTMIQIIIGTNTGAISLRDEFEDTRFFEPRVELKFNNPLESWIPTNFNASKKRIDDFLRDADNRFSG